MTYLDEFVGSFIGYRDRVSALFSRSRAVFLLVGIIVGAICAYQLKSDHACVENSFAYLGGRFVSRSISTRRAFSV